MIRISEHTATYYTDDVELESFDLNLLRVLDALLVLRSVSGAARRLNLSQPATSAALSRLRQALHDPLLVRSGNSMTPTPLAEELQARVKHILEEIGQALSTSAEFSPANTQRRFRIGANDYAALVLLAPLAERFRRLAPHATLEILPCDDGAEMRLATRELDIAVADRWSLRGSRTVEKLFHESFICIARFDHPRLSRRVTLKQFLAEDHALIFSCGVVPGVLDHALDASGRTRRVALTVPHFLVGPIVVAHTDMVMTIPRRVADCFASLHHLRTFVSPVPLEGFDVVLASHPRSAGEIPVQWLKNLVHAVASEIGKPQNPK